MTDKRHKKVISKPFKNKEEAFVYAAKILLKDSVVNHIQDLANDIYDKRNSMKGVHDARFK